MQFNPIILPHPPKEAVVTSAGWFVTLETSAKIRASKLVFGSWTSQNLTVQN